MLRTILVLAAVAAASFAAVADEAKPQIKSQMPSPLSYTMKSLDGQDVDLSKYKGKVVLVVNVASECGLTGQYKPLQRLHEKYKDQGFVVLGFPCNQFGSQEPGSAEEIKTFCTKNYGVTFDMFSKVDVNGDNAAPLYKTLTATATKPAGPGKISWNFEKFLIGRDGQVVARFNPRTEPSDEQVVTAIESELAKK
ncbi:MAG: glutathione peroxidase [Gemmataceae bacterium]|nr:glutathione peroxidase [Gemmataceae bacterium]